MSELNPNSDVAQKTGKKETILTTTRSKCCNAKVFVEGSDDFGDGSKEDVQTCYNVCSKCNKPCDIASPQQETVNDESEKKEDNIFDVTNDQKIMLIEYVSNNKIADFEKIPTTVKLSMCQNVKEWKGKHAVVSKREIAKKKVGNKWVAVMAPYLKHQVARKFLNFCFNFKISCEVVGEDQFVNYEEEYEKNIKEENPGGQGYTWKKEKAVRDVFEASVVRKFTLEDDKGNIITRTVRASAKAYKNTATSRYSVMESAESKAWTKVAKTFGIGDDLVEDEEKAYDTAAKNSEQTKKTNTPPASNYGY